MTVYDRHTSMLVYTFPEQYMPSCDGHMLPSQESSTGPRDMAVCDRHMTVYDGKGASFPSHSCYCDQYKTCYTGHFGFCTRYMTSCDWNMLVHPALPSFVPGGTRLARLNARLNAAL